MTTRTSSGSSVPQPAWTFGYLGANQDSYDEADHLGFDGTNTQNFRGDGLGTRHAMLSVDRAVRDYRRSPVADKQRRKKDLFGGLKEAETDHALRCTCRWLVGGLPFGRSFRVLIWPKHVFGSV